MAKLQRRNGAVSNVLRLKILDSSSTVGAGLTGLTSASSGLIIATIADNEATATAYTVAGSTIESITTLGTFAAPTATKCRFKEVDATNHKGLYELQIADARFAVSGAKALIISLLGATNAAQVDLELDLQADANLVSILGTLLTETTGQIAAGVKKLFDVATPVFTLISLNQTGDSYARLGAPAGASVSADVAAVKTDTAAVKVQTDKLVFTVANQVDVNVLDWKSATAPAMTGDAFARLGAPTGASLAADIQEIEAETDLLLAGVIVTTNNDKTGYALAAGGIIAGAHAAAELNAMADAILDRNMTTGTDNGTDSAVVRTVRQALRRLRNREAIATGVGTVYKEDDVTASWTYAATTAAGDPLSEVNPT